MKLLIEGNEFIGEPPAPAKTWGEYFENVVTTSRLSGLRVSALAEDGHETNFGIMSQVIDSSWVGHMRLAERVPARGTLLKRNTMKFFDRVYAEKTSQESRLVEPVAWMVYTLDGQSAFVTDNPAGLTPEHRALPLYTAPPKREPLTDAEIGSVAADIWGSMLIAPQSYQQFARAIERAHGIGGEE